MSRKTSKSKKLKNHRKHRNHRNHKSHRKLRKTQKSQSGGGIGCSPLDGYTPDIQAAGLGVGYTENPGRLHTDGETLSFNELVHYNENGMLEWYAKKYNLTPEEYTLIKGIPEVKVLGVFFLRYKIVSENIDKVMSLYKKLKNLSPTQLSSIESGKMHPLTMADVELVNNYTRDKLYELRLNIEISINMTQCMLWYIIKNKGLPADFKMDPRIESLANEPVLLNTYSLAPGRPVDTGLIEFASVHQYEFMSKWIKKTMKVSTMFETPVTFD